MSVICKQKGILCQKHETSSNDIELEQFTPPTKNSTHNPNINLMELTKLR